VRLPETAPAQELRDRIALSYDLIRAGLPASVRRELAAREEE
jgi:predicted DNA-binding protein (MmcQ/YjbR family)